MTDSSKQLPQSYHQGYCYFDVNTGKFWIDTTDAAAGRMAINAYKANIATLANAAIYETTEAVNAPLHKINTYYGHGLSLNGTTLSLVAGDNNTTLSSITLPPDTHWTTHLYAGDGTAANKATTNGNTKISVADNSTIRNSITIKGTGATSVSSDTNGIITINSNNTTYSAGTGLSLSGTTFNHSNSVTAKTAAAQAAKTLTWGGTFTLYEEKYDSQGHITGVANYNMTMPSNPNTDYRVRQTNDTSNTNYRLLLSNSANSTQEDNITHKNDNLIYNPSTMTLSTGNLNLTGELDVVGNAYLHNETQADSLTAGSLLVTGNANFTQIPTAPTPASGSNDTSVATTAFVMNAFTANDAMVFKGVINSNSGLPAAHKQGWTYKVGTAGQYAGVNCEVGDTIYCVEDGTSANNAHWAVVQANVDVPLYKDGNTFAGSKVLMSDGTGGKVKEGTIATQTVIKTATLSQGTLPTLGTAIAADDITAWDAGSTPTLGTAFSVPNVTGNTSVTASKVTKADVTVVTNVSQAASTSSVIATVADGVLTIAKAITAVGAVTKSTGTANTVTISDVSASKVTLGTAFSIPNVTGVGSIPSLSYTARTIPNVTGVGTLPSLSTTTQSVVTGIS